jgi:hypothetical protein
MLIVLAAILRDARKARISDEVLTLFLGQANQRFARQAHHKKIFLFPFTPNHL